MNSTLIIAILILCAACILILSTRHSRNKNAETPNTRTTPAGRDAQPAQAASSDARKASAGVISFPIAGTALSGRQRTLHMIDDSDDERYLCCTYGIDKTEYNGSPAFKIYAELSDDDNTHKDLGLAPAEQVSDVASVYDRIFRVNVVVNSIQSGQGYGATATLYYEK